MTRTKNNKTDDKTLKIIFVLHILRPDPTRPDLSAAIKLPGMVSLSCHELRHSQQFQGPIQGAGPPYFDKVNLIFYIVYNV